MLAVEYTVVENSPPTPAVAAWIRWATIGDSIVVRRRGVVWLA